MCGRFFFGENINLEKYHQILRRKYQQTQLDLYSCGEKYPGELILTYGKDDYDLKRWSYQLFNRKIINSRIESIDKYYRDDFKNNKCLILANGFYEFDENKHKYYFRTAQDIIYLAGIYQKVDEFNNCSILTTKASASKHIHDRIPIVLNKDEADAYLNNELSNDYLADKHPDFEITTNFENLSLF